MTDLTADEQRYLLDAFDVSPRAWFRPTEVAQQRFSDRQIDRIVAGLVTAGLVDCLPDCHARLTDHGRRHAVQLGKPPRDGWRHAQGRRKVWFAVVSAAGVAVISLILFRWSGIL